MRPSVYIVEDKRGRRARCGGSCCTTGTASERWGGGRSRDQNSYRLAQLNGGGREEGTHESSLLWKNGVEHLQNLALGKLCAEGIVHPGGL